MKNIFVNYTKLKKWDIMNGMVFQMIGAELEMEMILKLLKKNGMTTNLSFLKFPPNSNWKLRCNFNLGSIFPSTVPNKDKA